jgi:hypothetical protein
LLDSSDRLFAVSKEISHGTPSEDALLKLIEFTVPCLLHLENRSREAFLTRIINNLFNRNLPPAEVEAKLKEVQDLLNADGHGTSKAHRGQVRLIYNPRCAHAYI